MKWKFEIGRPDMNAIGEPRMAKRVFLVVYAEGDMLADAEALAIDEAKAIGVGLPIIERADACDPVYAPGWVEDSFAGRA
jgi:hypothetical protein